MSLPLLALSHHPLKHVSQPDCPMRCHFIKPGLQSNISGNTTYFIFPNEWRFMVYISILKALEKSRSVQGSCVIVSTVFFKFICPKNLFQSEINYHLFLETQFKPFWVWTKLCPVFCDWLVLEVLDKYMSYEHTEKRKTKLTTQRISSCC